MTEEELAMMQKYKIDDDDGKIDRAEYMLLCAVRIGALDLSLLAAMNERFDKLDSDKSGALDYRELLEQVKESNAKKDIDIGEASEGKKDSNDADKVETGTKLSQVSPAENA